MASSAAAFGDLLTQQLDGLKSCLLEGYRKDMEALWLENEALNGKPPSIAGEVSAAEGLPAPQEAAHRGAPGSLARESGGGSGCAGELEGSTSNRFPVLTTISTTTHSSHKFVLDWAWRNQQQAQWSSANEMDGMTATKTEKLLRTTSRYVQQNKSGMVEKLMVDPNSWSRTIWVLLGLVFLVYDIVMVPLDVFFELKQTTFMNGVLWAGRGYWTADIPASFLTGVYSHGNLIMSPRVVALTYAKSWLLFDLLIMTPEWLAAASGQTSPFSVVRALRLFRVLRLLRLAKLKDLTHDFFLAAPKSVVLCTGMLEVAAILATGIHLVACVWYGLGVASHEGWVYQERIESEEVLDKYLMAAHWAVAHLGGTSHVHPGNALEYAFAVLVMLLSFIVFAFFLGKVTQVLNSLSDVRDNEKQQFINRYLRTRRVSPTVARRVNRYMYVRVHRGSAQKGLAELLEFEANFLKTLPAFLQRDLFSELRGPVLESLQLFSSLTACSPRVMQQLCTAAVSSVLGLKDERVFSFGDLCGRALFLESGACSYISCRDEVEDIHSSAGVHHHEELVTRGMYLSEAVLWTQWKHQGNLRATQDSTLLALNAEDFRSMVTQQASAWMHASTYARQFVWYLNHLSPGEPLSDLMFFSQDKGQPADILNHLAFISHFKAEAGTEATLLKEAIEKMLREDASDPACDFNDPVFLDSDNLTDLSQLKEHVERSSNLILLLTDGVLKRPWCLLEIFTAVSAKVQIVPVEVLRPGVAFEYPDEAFFEALHKGEGLTDSDWRLIRGEGVEPAELAEAVRQAFRHIALPFSPHKAAAIRQAEIAGIMARCSK